VNRRYLNDTFALALLAAACVALFVTAPKHGEFAWSEAPRNALNGVFILDFLRELPLSDPVGWAQAYYYRYPALTIGVYPPLFHSVLAAFYLVFGVSHATAIACVSVFAFVFAAGTFALARTAASSAVAFATALFVLAAPEVFSWSQQVMLETPMLAFAVWAAYFLNRYMESDRPIDLAVAAALMLASIYTKQFALIIAAALSLALLASKGWGLFTRRHVWITGAAVLVGLAPLAVMQAVLGRANVMAATLTDRPPDGSFSPFTWYAEHLDDIVGLPILALGIAGIAAALARRAWRPPRRLALLLALWFAVGYVGLTALPNKEPRYGLLLAIPIAFAAAYFLGAVLPRGWRFAAPGVVAGAAFAWTLAEPSTTWITGYREAAEAIARVVPPNGRVLFAGNRDGSFIFNVRSEARRPDIMVVRADKLFLDIPVLPSRGLNPREVSAERIRTMLRDLGIGYVVTVPNVWAETRVMEDFARVLDEPPFEEIARIPVAGHAEEKQLVVYRNSAPLKDPPDDFTIELRGHDLSIRP
jgi:4-amino-4-deoxy-L-arabinose transferase-like glycosyltransferase